MNIKWEALVQRTPTVRQFASSILRLAKKFKPTITRYYVHLRHSRQVCSGCKPICSQLPAEYIVLVESQSSHLLTKQRRCSQASRSTTGYEAQGKARGIFLHRAGQSARISMTSAGSNTDVRAVHLERHAGRTRLVSIAVNVTNASVCV